MKSGQLLFVFADNSKESEKRLNSGVPEGKSFLLHTAKARKAIDFIAAANVERRELREVATLENLARALLQVARNKGASGVDKESVDEVVMNAHKLLPNLQRRLLEGRFVPGEIRRVWIPKPGGGQRGLGIPNVVDRWVQQAVLQIMAPIFEPKFHNSSHGFRPRRGSKTAIAEAKEYVGEGRTWIVGVDLSKFFDRVNHQRLMARVGRSIRDKSLLILIDQMLKANVVMPDGTRVQTLQGTPQGGPLSPLLSNIVLDELDWEMDRRGLKFVRYADDFIIFVKSERAGRRVMDSLKKFI